MARGWESKSVESQQDEAQRRPTDRTGAALPPEERERRQRLLQLQLALASTQEELQKACHPHHRDMLRQRLEAIRAQLEGEQQ